MPPRCPADLVLARRQRSRAAEMPLTAKSHERPSLSQRGPIQRQATRRGGEHTRSRNEYLLAIARENDAGGKTASTRVRWKIVRVVSGWGF